MKHPANSKPSTPLPSTDYSSQSPSKREIGQIYEDEASSFLSKRGLKFVAKNVFFRVGEIDLIFLERQTLVFVEVRYRSKEKSYETALQSLGFGKLHRLRRAIERYLQVHSKIVRENRVQEIRVDVLAFSGGGVPEWVRGLEL